MRETLKGHSLNGAGKGEEGKRKDAQVFEAQKTSTWSN